MQSGAGVKRFVRTALAVGLALASSTAAALGLGQIELKSRLGEPLLAEIPIISNDPAELERLRAGLASPATFARVGLQPPDAVVANLQFVSALDARGNPVIRVTSSQPIEQPLLTFLIEVDWGQGRLVREYSTLLDAPRTVSAPMQPPIDAPVAAPSNAIVREPAAPVAAAAPPTRAETEPEPEPLSPAPLPAAAPAPTAAPIATAPAPAPEPAARPDQYGAVQTGETLSQITARLDLGASIDQGMIALLNANPDAFIGGNINLLKSGVVLRVPDAEEVRNVALSQAIAQVREQSRAWRAASAPVPQPAVADTPAPSAAQGVKDPPSDTPAAVAGGARLEIVPPGASDASQAGTQSGISAGAEGDMVRQQQMQAQETLAARNAELADLKGRVAELEKLQSDQQKLLQMKDNELAAVQQRLAQTQEQEVAVGNPGLPWLLGGVGLLLLGLLGGWWMRRRAEINPRFTVPSGKTGTSPLAAAFPAAPTAIRQPVPPEAAQPQPRVQPAVAVPGPTEVDSAEPSGRATGGSVPTWHAVTRGEATTLLDDVGVAPAAGDSDAPGRERLELARAYLDLGDRESARQLLGEVAVNGDHATRQQATQMLRELE